MQLYLRHLSWDLKVIFNLLDKLIVLTKYNKLLF